MQETINASTLILSCGDITKESIDAIVNAANRKNQENRSSHIRRLD
ncbi:MAG: hypothetical protein NTX92_08615 [Euryarchaeota archaeon]|nr:hypothetical protein [Euryarchaeota archaeon]